MTMTREEMQRLASYGRDGDTMLAHINPEEAALLKSRGGSGTINPNTGLPEYKKFWKQASISNVVNAVNNPVATAKDLVQQVAANPIGQIAIAYYMPYLVAEFAPSLAVLGIEGAAQTAVANAIASTTIQIAQGVSLDQALQNAVTNAVVSSGSSSIAQDINKVIQNPDVTNAIVSAGKSATQTALAGGSQSDIEKSIVGGLVGSGVASVTGSNVAGSAAAGGVTGGVNGALKSAASAASQIEAERIATERTKSTETKVSNIIGDELSKVGIAGALPAGDTGAYARALENANQTLIRLVKEAANDVNYLQKLPQLEDALVKSGTSISKVLGTGVSLGTYTTELDANQDAELKNRLKDAKVEITFSPLTPTDVKPFPPVANVDLTKTEDIDPRLLDIVSPPVTETGVTTTPYSPTIVTPTITPGTGPEVIPGTAPVVTPITTPSTDTSTSPSTSPTPGTEPIIDPTISPSTSPSTSPNTLPSTSPSSDPVISPSTTPKTVTSTEPVVSPPVVTSPYSPVVLPTDNKTSVTDTSVTSPVTTTPINTTTDTTDVTTTDTTTDTTPIDTTTTDTTTTSTDTDVPVEDKTGTPTTTKPAVITTTKVTPKTPLTKILQPSFYGTRGGLTSFRGAGELESPATGKKRKNVWNESSLRLKDALGL